MPSDVVRRKISLSAIEYRATPFESFGRLRELGPVVPAKISVVGDVWLITTFDAVAEALKDDEKFCREPKNAGKSYAWLKFLVPGVFRGLINNMIAKDEPDHRRLRSLADEAFQRQEVESLRSKIEQFTDQALDEIERTAKRDGSVDLLKHLSRPVPLAAICELLGLPEEDRPKFRKWFSNFADVNSAWGIPKIVPGLWRTMRYLEGQFAVVKANPRPGLMSELIQSEQSGDKLNDEELLAMVTLLLLAGHETTVHLINTSILTLLQLDDVRESLASDWTRIDDCVEEMLRFNSPVQFTKPRFVARDTEFYGQSMSRGDLILPVLASANSDPDRFENPTQFDMNRDKNFHLAFGYGPHVCLGLKLARLETAVVLERLFRRFPNTKPAFDVNHPPWSRRMGMRSVSQLRVRLG